MQSIQLDQSFLEKEDVVYIAKALLGMTITTNFDGQETSGMIVETEAYRAPEDKASHAYNFRRTARNEVMYGEAGMAYVYLCYGLHHLFNIVTGPSEIPHAVLIRAIEPIVGIEVMKDRRKSINVRQLTNGPGKWTQAFGITTKQTGLDLFSNKSPIQISQPAHGISSKQIISTPRIGISYAAEWVDKPWRFVFTS